MQNPFGTQQLIAQWTGTYASSSGITTKNIFGCSVTAGSEGVLNFVLNQSANDNDVAVNIFQYSTAGATFVAGDQQAFNVAFNNSQGQPSTTGNTCVVTIGGSSAAYSLADTVIVVQFYAAGEVVNYPSGGGNTP